MGYFNFYIIKKLINSFFHYIRKNKRFIIIFIIFVCILFIKEKCFAFDYDADYYVQWNDSTRGKTYRVTSDKPIIIIPKQSYPSALNCNDMFTGNILQISEYENGTLRFTGSGSWFMDNTDFYGKNVSISTYKGYYIAFKYDTTLHSIYEFSANCPPFIYNRVDIPNWDFTDLQIVLGDTIQPYPHDERWTFILTVQYNGVNYTYDITNDLQQVYFEGNSNINTYGRLSIPRYDILNDIVVKKNDIVRFYLQTKYTTNNVDYIIDNYNLGSYTIGADLSTSENLSAINDNISNVDNSVQELKDTITDPTVDSGASDLPSTNVNDPTQTGIDNIFDSIYNAFCTGTAQDIVFPVPFTNKSITLSPYYVRDMLNNNGAGWVYTLIQAFWGYLIGRFIVYDVMKKISKIKSGNIEELETNNIKGDML